MAGPSQKHAQVLRLLYGGREHKVRKALKELGFKKARASQLVMDTRQCPPKSHLQRSQTVWDRRLETGTRGGRLSHTHTHTYIYIYLFIYFFMFKFICSFIYLIIFYLIIVFYLYMCVYVCVYMWKSLYVRLPNALMVVWLREQIQ